MLTRREFLSFFLLGGIIHLFKEKVKAEEKTKVAMFWRRIDCEQK